MAYAQHGRHRERALPAGVTLVITFVRVGRPWLTHNMGGTGSGHCPSAFPILPHFAAHAIIKCYFLFRRKGFIRMFEMEESYVLFHLFGQSVPVGE